MKKINLKLLGRSINLQGKKKTNILLFIIPISKSGWINKPNCWNFFKVT